jgi:hypothetical protein
MLSFIFLSFSKHFNINNNKSIVTLIQDVVQDLGIVSLVPTESDKVKLNNHASIPMHHGLAIDHTEHTFILNLKVRVSSKLPMTSGIKFLLSPNV